MGLLWEKLIATGALQEKTMGDVLKRLYDEGKLNSTCLQCAVDSEEIAFTQEEMNEIIA